MAKIENADFTNLYLRRATLALWLLPWFVYGLLYIVAPGFISPLLNHPSRCFLIFFGLWETAGCTVLSFFLRNKLAWLTTTVLCVLPLLVLPVLYPWIHPCILQRYDIGY
jgi:hypothetical protein